MTDRAVIGAGHNFISPDEIANLTPDLLVARLLEMSDRGTSNMRTNVPLPDDVYGEWCPNDPGSIADYTMKGFKIDDTYATQYSLHSDGSGKPIVGDVIFMTCPMKLKKALLEVDKIRFKRVHGQAKNLPEETNAETEFTNLGLANKYKGADINTSIQKKVGPNEIMTAVAGGNQ